MGEQGGNVKEMVKGGRGKEEWRSKKKEKEEEGKGIKKKRK